MSHDQAAAMSASWLPSNSQNNNNKNNNNNRSSSSSTSPVASLASADARRQRSSSCDAASVFATNAAPVSALKAMDADSPTKMRRFTLSPKLLRRRRARSREKKELKHQQKLLLQQQQYEHQKHQVQPSAYMAKKVCPGPLDSVTDGIL